MPQGHNNPQTSTEYSKHRYAHPFFLPTSHDKRQPINGQTRMTDWSKKQLGPIPAVKGDGTLKLEDVIGKQGVKEIEDVGEIRFHALGDSGVGQAQEAEAIADEMATDFNPGSGGMNPAFLLHLGDVIYGPDKEAHYVDRFYRPYRHYPGKILGIAGNHDGEERSAADSPSLKDFLTNFCAASAAVPPQAASSGIYRETMIQPGVFWMMDAPFVRIVGLYSNRLENPGYLNGSKKNGAGDNSQIAWLGNTLKQIAEAKEKKSLVIATHHPPYSAAGHSGSTEMNQTIDEVCTKSGVTPDLFLSGHAHNYQRYTRHLNGREVPYIVAGTGGMPPQKVPSATGQPVGATGDLTYDSALASYGYLFVSASSKKITIEFWPNGDGHTKAYDAVEVDLSTHLVTQVGT